MKKPHSFLLLMLLLGVIGNGLLWNSDAYLYQNLTSLGSLRTVILLTLLLSPLVIALLLPHLKEKQLSRGAKRIVIPFAGFSLLLIAVNLITFGVGKQRYTQLQSTFYPVQPITLQQTSQIQEAQVDCGVYFHRSDCAGCDTASLLIEEIAQIMPVQILSYDTAADRDLRPDEMYPLLEKYQVTTVPTVVIFLRGQGAQRYVGEEEIRQKLAPALESYQAKELRFFTDESLRAFIL